ncbi:MAG: transposase [Candidatus Heimdallarchaeota archaeon]|nr:transposase [Candidatus Heimdallarchaeota archaeon]
MRKKLPPYMIFDYLSKKVIAVITSIAEKSGWDQPPRGIRYYGAYSMMSAILYYYIAQLGSLDTLEGELHHDLAVREACGFEDFTPSKTTLSLFMQRLGAGPVKELFDELVKLMQEEGLVTGRHLAIDSTHVNAWSDRKSTDKKDPEFKIAKNCDFARLGRTPKGFDICYRVQTATVTNSEIPIAIEILPGNTNDKKAFEGIFEKALEVIFNPLVVSADKGYSSGKNRQLVDDVGAMCIIRPTKTDLKGHPMEFFLPEELIEEKYWKLYTRRLAVERTYSRTKGFSRLGQPRVVNEEPVRQHVFLSFVCHLLMVLVSAEMGLKQTKYSLFS